MINRRRALAAALLTPAGIAIAAESSEDAAHARIHNDWAYLGRYREANRQVVKGSADVVFLGDSITEGWSDKTPLLFRAGRLNRGIGGQTSPQMLVRFRQDVVDLAPKAVHIMAGTNDIAGNTGPATLDTIQANFRSMVEIAQSNGIAVILASVPPASHFPWKPDVQTVQPIVELNRWLSGYAREKRAVYADYFRALTDERSGMRTGLAYDGVHPSAEGYAVMNPIAEAAITGALARA